ncbi:MAG: response regulator [Magnetococcales bacterium]|nr:response regulator [Magnetococcales bacterium]
MAKILIMDTDITQSTILRSFLEIDGHSVFSTNNGRKGLDIIDSEVLDLLFLDINLPGHEGFKFLERIPDDLRNNTIITSHQASIAPIGFLKQLARCNGAFGALNKPFEKKSIAKLVNRLLRH